MLASYGAEPTICAKSRTQASFLTGQMSNHEISFNTDLSEPVRTRALFSYKITPSVIGNCWGEAQASIERIFNTESQRRFAEIRLRACIRIGEISRDLETHQGLRAKDGTKLTKEDRTDRQAYVKSKREDTSWKHSQEIHMQDRSKSDYF
jgi:hypothetical protein